MNGIDIEESIQEGVILDLNKKIPIKRILAEDEPIWMESENDSFKEMWNIKIENDTKREKNWKRNQKRCMQSYLKSSVKVICKIELNRTSNKTVLLMIY